MKIAHWSQLTDDDRRRLARRDSTIPEEVVATCRTIIEAVRADGDAAVRRFEREFGAGAHADLRVSADEVAAAVDTLPGDVRRALDHAIERIERFHRFQLPPPLWMAAFPEGTRAGERTVPVESVGCYVPRGKGSFGSVLVMLGVPARVAGVGRIAVASPPDGAGHLDPATLYVAHRLGLKTVYRMGGAQAIAALALGTETVTPVAKLLGPGNRYVTAAKQLLAGVVDIGLQSGPSESVVLADESVAPDLVALDLCNEAEHGPDSISYLVTPSAKVARAVAAAATAIASQLPQPRRGWVETVLTERGGALVTSTLDEAVEVVDMLATEHLVLDVAEPYALLDRIHYAGEIIIGPNTPVAACNYMAGPNAVLPTGGFARSMSALGVRDFLRTASIVQLTPSGLEAVRSDVACLARAEGFPVHVAAVETRPPAVDGAQLEWIRRRVDHVIVAAASAEAHVLVSLERGAQRSAPRPPLALGRGPLDDLIADIGGGWGVQVAISAADEGGGADLATLTGQTLGAAVDALGAEEGVPRREAVGAAVVTVGQTTAEVHVRLTDGAALRAEGLGAGGWEADEGLAALASLLSAFTEAARADVRVVVTGALDPSPVRTAIVRGFGQGLHRALAPDPHPAARPVAAIGPG